MTPRRVAVLSTGRQDFGILRSTLVTARHDPRVVAELWIGGMHLSDVHGRTVRQIEREGFVVSASLDFLVGARDSVEAASRAVLDVARALRLHRPDALLLVGDRTETLAAGFAATLERVPVVHLHGGEETTGAIDNVCRHALTKLSHLHLVSQDTHARRVLQMGEDPASVVVVGAPGLDNLYRSDLPDRVTLEQALDFQLGEPLVIVTVHPTTLAQDPTEEVNAIAAAMDRVPARYIVTSPNADAGGDEIRQFWNSWTSAKTGVRFVEALGETSYWGLLRIADAVLGNSSSGIIEAPVAGVPSINVGERQAGRTRLPGTIDVPPVATRVADALREALGGELQSALEKARSAFPAGPAAPRILDAIASWEVPRPPRKAFRDILWPALH